MNYKFAVKTEIGKVPSEAMMKATNKTFLTKIILITSIYVKNNNIFIKLMDKIFL